MLKEKEKTKEELLKIISKCVDKSVKLVNKSVKINNKKDKAEKELKELELPVDGWYIIPNNDYKNWMAYFVEGLMVILLNRGEFTQINKKDCIKLSGCNPLARIATQEESTEQLTKFFNRKGYIKGVEIITPRHKEEGVLNGFNVKLTQDLNEYLIWLGGYVIWSSEKGWAKIINNSKPLTKSKFKVMSKGFGFNSVGEKYHQTIRIESKIDFNGGKIIKELEVLLNKEND